MRTRVATALGIAFVVVVTVLCVHKYDNWKAAKVEAARQQAIVNDQRAEAAAAAKKAKFAEDTKTYQTCLASQKSFDAQTAAVRAKAIRPACVAPVAQ